jgi:hypothetical protein
VARRPAGDIAAAQGELTAEAGRVLLRFQAVRDRLLPLFCGMPCDRRPPDERTVLQELFDLVSSRPRWLVARPVAAAFIGRELSWPRFVPPSVPPSGRS